MAKRLTLIIGGARSGKSSFAEMLARQRGGDDVLFLATAQALDEEMRARIAQHRAGRPAAWRTLETSQNIARALQSVAPASVVLIDCLTLLVSNILLADERAASATVAREIDELLAWHNATACDLIIVTNEVGLGIVPENALARAYRDLLGAANRQVAQAADRVLWLAAGLPIDLKAHALKLEDL